VCLTSDEKTSNGSQNEKHPKQPLFQAKFLPVILPPEIKAK
jgi:hypothetical protein